MALSAGDEVNTWVQRLAEAKLDMAQTKEERIAVLREAVQGMKDHEAIVQKMFQAGTAGAMQLDVVAAKYARLGMEARLAKETAQ
jgi:outer membrane protein TolC